MKVINNTNFELTVIQKDFVKIATIENRWRERNVTIYKHPHDDFLVLTVGISFNNEITYVCEEPVDNYTNVISYCKGGRTYIFN